jgi:surfeit locus 1 family protein
MHRVKAVLVVLLGLAVAAGMGLAGVWQLQVYQRQGAEAAAARAAEPPVALLAVAPVNQRVGDGYGRTVTVAGSYEPAHQVRVPVAEDSGRLRVVTLLRTEDGRALAVVRGLAADGDAGVRPPGGPQQVQGVFLPSEQATPAGGPDGLGSLRIPQLAQRWPGPLIDGFVTLGAVDAQAQGLVPAPVALPEGRGRLRNGAYALQWWLFAAFTVVMAGRIARDVGRPAVAADLDE